MELKIIPRMSEKTVVQAMNGVFTFNVPLKANKQQIATAVSKQYGVEVVTVNIAIAKGKVKSAYRKGGSPVISKRSDVKKAYVRLADGQTIPAFTEEKK